MKFELKNLHFHPHEDEPEGPDESHLGYIAGSGAVGLLLILAGVGLQKNNYAENFWPGFWFEVGGASFIALALLLYRYSK